MADSDQNLNTGSATTAIENAIKLFEAHPDFPRVQVQMRARMAKAEQNVRSGACAFRSKARLSYVLRLFVIRAEAFLELVFDINSQNAFMDLLGNLGRTAWEEFAGWPPELLRPVSAEMEGAAAAIHMKVQRWTYKGYQRLESLGNPQHEPDPAPPMRSKRLNGTVTSLIAARRMENYLAAKGIGVTEFARQAHTTDRTLRAFRKTGQVRRDIFDAIVEAMGTTKEALLKPE